MENTQWGQMEQGNRKEECVAFIWNPTVLLWSTATRLIVIRLGIIYHAVIFQSGGTQGALNVNRVWTSRLTDIVVWVLKVWHWAGWLRFRVWKDIRDVPSHPLHLWKGCLTHTHTHDISVHIWNCFEFLICLAFQRWATFSFIRMMEREGQESFHSLWIQRLHG